MNNIISAFLVMAIIGLVLALLLYIASIYFSVEENESVKKVREVLPGLNCGACGFPGCDGYAKAIAEEGAAHNKCLPGGDKVKAKIDAVMSGASIDSDTGSIEESKKVAYVMCNGDCNLVKDKKILENMTCKEADKEASGCKYGCLGCGDCQKACKFDAIIIKDGLAFVYEDKCVACGACVAACPRNIIELVPLSKRIRVACSNHDLGKDVNPVCKVGCIACGMCEKQCNFDAVHVTDNLAKIDYEKCTECEACFKICPKKTIDNLKYID